MPLSDNIPNQCLKDKKEDREKSKWIGKYLQWRWEGEEEKKLGTMVA